MILKNEKMWGAPKDVGNQGLRNFSPASEGKGLTRI